MIWLEETLISYLSVQTSHQLLSFPTSLHCGQELREPDSASKLQLWEPFNLYTGAHVQLPKHTRKFHMRKSLRFYKNLRKSVQVNSWNKPNSTKTLSHSKSNRSTCENTTTNNNLLYFAAKKEQKLEFSGENASPAHLRPHNSKKNIC